MVLAESVTQKKKKKRCTSAQTVSMLSYCVNSIIVLFIFDPFILIQSQSRINAYILNDPIII